MKSWKKPTNELVDRTMGLFEKETDRLHFFSRLKNPWWIQPLTDRGRFELPPSVRYLPEGFVQYPVWPELRFLKNVSQEVPEQVIRLVLQFPETDNLSVYEDILDIALALKGEQSVCFKTKILEYVELGSYRLPHEFAKLLAHWTTENQTQAALELADALVQFHPDTQADEKRERLAENNRDEFTRSIDTLLVPRPRFDDWNYHEIMDKGVRPLAGKKPYEIAHMLTQATANMIHDSTHQNILERGLSIDSSEIWCPKLEGQHRKTAEAKETLVNTLTYASKEVYRQLPSELIASLDHILREQRWDVFKRLRQHLYTLFPNDQTKPWIRELILGYGDYAADRDYPYEFQRMLRRSCEHFGAALLSEDERTGIFESILGGPPLKDHRERMGDKYTETNYQQWKHEFHRLQLRPFSPVLFGKYADYYNKLNNDKTKEAISDDTYLPFRVSKGGFFTYRSPKSVEDLSKLKDEDLLTYINEWQDEHADKENWLVKINIPALAGAFQDVFLNSVIPDADRVTFWLERKRDQIKRPIYVEHIVRAIRADVESGKFEQLERWFEFCQWVLSHQDEDHEVPIRYRDSLREDLSWRSSRRAVGEFVEVCLKEEVKVPISARKGLAKLLEAICTQFDWVLDRREQENAPYDEAINSIRGRALENLFKLGHWIRRHDAELEITEIESILEQRFSSEVGLPLTIPEYALLGQYFAHVFHLNQPWTVNNKSDFFPKDNLSAWQAGFGQFLCGNGPYIPIFETVRDDYEFALSHIDGMNQQNKPGREVPDALGEHLFIYYVRGVFSMTGACSLLECFYNQFEGERERWATLFDYVGRELSSTGKQQLDEALKDKIRTFFDWRLKIGEPKELREFTFWLEAECLEADWRLDAYSRILEIPRVLDSKFGEPRYSSLHTMALRKMIPKYTAKVVECFAKLIQSMPEEGLIYLPANDAKSILKVGFNHEDENVRRTAERAREDLLQGGQLDFLDLDD